MCFALGLKSTFAQLISTGCPNYFFVAKILYMPVLHFEQFPLTARRPFFPNATSFQPSAKALLALHFTQYPSMFAI